VCCAAGAAAAGAAGRNSTHAEQAQQGSNSTLLCSITAILVRNCGLGTARFAELAAGAGVRAYGVPSHAAGGRCLQILANAGAAKNGPMRELDRLGGGLIALLWCDVVWRALVLFSSTVRSSTSDCSQAATAVVWTFEVGSKICRRLVSERLTACDKTLPASSSEASQ